MTTVIVFADLYRDRPLVLKAYAETFDLLFRQENANVVVRRRWQREKEKADMVLRVSRKYHRDEKDGNDVVTPYWKVVEHPSSPCKLANASLQQKTDVKSIERVINEETVNDVRSSVGLLFGGGDPSRAVLSGSVFQFGLSSASRARDYRMMLFDEVEEEPSAEQEVEETPVEEVKKPNLTDLPDLPLRKIVGYLDPTPATLLALPLISTSIFDFMKREPDLGVLDIGGSSPGLDDLDALCGAAHETCVRLKVSKQHFGLFSGSNYVPGQRSASLVTVLNKILVQFEWSSLKILELYEGEAGFWSEAVQHALRKNNFPKLEVLRVIPQERGYSSGAGTWRFFTNCALPNLRELVAETVYHDGLWVNEEDAREFFGQFPNLEKFHLVYGGRSRPSKAGSNVKLVLMHGFEAGLVPQLKELKLVAFRTLTFTDGHFSDPRLERLSLGVPDKEKYGEEEWDDDSEYDGMDHDYFGGFDSDNEYDPNYYDPDFMDFDADEWYGESLSSSRSPEPKELDCRQLLHRFPGLKSLSLTPDFAVRWNSPGRQLAGLKELRCVHGKDNPNAVPIEHLANLEHLWLHLLDKPNPLPLAGLSDLRVLKLSGMVKWESLPKLLPNLPCNLRILHLDLAGTVDVHKANSRKFVSVFLKFFSQVDVLRFGSIAFDSPAQFSRHVSLVEPQLEFELRMGRSSSEAFVRFQYGREKPAVLRFPLPAGGKSKPLHGQATFKKILPPEEERQIGNDPFEDPFFC